MSEVASHEQRREHTQNDDRDCTHGELARTWTTDLSKTEHYGHPS
jgi:hypothetical protein